MIENEREKPIDSSLMHCSCCFFRFVWEDEDGDGDEDEDGDEDGDGDQDGDEDGD